MKEDPYPRYMLNLIAVVLVIISLVLIIAKYDVEMAKIKPQPVAGEISTNAIYISGGGLPRLMVIDDLPPYAEHEDEESKTEGVRTLTALVHNPDVPTESQIRRAKDIKREAQPNCEAPFCNAIRSRNGNRCDIHHRITNLEALRTKQYYLMTNQANLITFCRLHHYEWGHSGTGWRNFTANLDEIIDKAEAAGLAVYSNQIERVVR